MKIEIWLYSLITAISCFNINLEDDILISKDFEMIMIDKKIFISISNKLKDSIDKYYFQAYNIQNERKYLKVWYSAEGDSNKLLLFQDLRAEDSSFSKPFSSTRLFYASKQNFIYFFPNFFIVFY